MIDQVDFLEKHKRIREASETVLLMESPRRWGKSLRQEMILNSNQNITLMKGGAVYGVKCRTIPVKYFCIKRTKLLQSSSKQSRMVSVVCK